MADTVIVALPEENDYVRRISSQKEPHLTLLYLGDEFDMDNLESVVRYIEHIAKTSLYRFGLSVDTRGPLGDKNADVLFFENGWQAREIKETIGYLLADPHIANAYDRQPHKFPKWIPHLTLGYPDDPAKEDDRDYPGIHWVNFDRLAIWTGDSEGPEFRLKSNDLLDAGEIAMADEASSLGESFADYFLGEPILEHYGVKGMKWGVRRADRVPTGVALKETPGRRIKAKGGQYEKASDDARRTAVQRQTAKNSSTDALSNAELKQLVERMQLEANYARLAQQERGNTIVMKLLQDPKYRNKQVATLSSGANLAGKGVQFTKTAKANGFKQTLKSKFANEG